MESNNNNNNYNNNNVNIQDEKAKNIIVQAIKNADFSAIFDIMRENSSPTSIYLILDQIFEALSSSKVEKFFEFCFTIFEQILINYQFPIVLWMNHPTIAKAMEKLLTINSTKERVSDVLALSLETFSFDKDRAQIQNLAALWKKAHPKKPFPTSNNKLSPFAEFYIKKQSLIRDSENPLELPPQRQKELSKKIEEFLTKESFANPKFNFLEKDLANYYFNELVRVLDIFGSLNSEQVVEEVPANNNHGLDVRRRDSDGEYPKETRLRTSFFLYEKLEEDEGMEIEYKNYYWKFNDKIDQVITKTICGFLNRFGGRMYIGIHDNGTVLGIKLTSQQRDEARRHVLELLNAFEPSNIKTSNLVDIIYLPIKNPADNKKIPGLFIMKIIVKQGDFSKLYSASKEFSSFYQRNPGQTVILRPAQIVEVITERLLRPPQKKDAQDFVDPPSEKLANIEEDLNKSFALKQEHSEAQGFLSKAMEVSTKNIEKPIPVQIRGLPKDVPVDEASKELLLDNFKQFLARPPRIFYEKGLTNSGGAYLNFKNRRAAEDYLQFLAQKKNGVFGFIKDD